jgi:hypothetical protein
MRSYSEEEIFSEAEVLLLQKATKVVAGLNASGGIRCHELARAIGWLLELEVQDGYYGFVDHSWLWTTRLDLERVITPRLGLPNILDVYCVGSMPMVRLVDCQHTALPHVGWSYRPSEKRRDIDEGLVTKLHAMAREVLFR